MCTQPHSIAKKAYDLFFETNLGDQGLFPAVAQLEKEVIAQLSDLLNGKGICGFIVSGGTEANLLALLIAKNTAKKPAPEVVLPASAHFSFTKICRLLNLKPIYAPLDSAYRVDIKAVEGLISENTVALVGTAGTAELGVVDSIEALSDIAVAHGLHLHVDAAFGGLVLPFLPNAIYPFDFRLEGVKSVTVDPHKMGMAAIPAGGILFRNPEMLEALKTETPYLNDQANYTFVGTRSGASAASAWAVFRLLGREGFQQIVAECMRNTAYLADGLRKAGFSLVCEPTVNVVAFQSKNTKLTAQRLWKRGWFVSYIPRYDCIRVVVMPHVKRRHAQAFLSELTTEKL
jgi:tyrosine decarboxylase/aspartate 1-decarboxylase